MLNELSHGQRERLNYIDFCLQFYGDIARHDLIQRFQMGLASSSRDFATYKEIAPDNLILKHETKRYHRTQKFKPLFAHNSDKALAEFAENNNFGNSLNSEQVVSSVSLINAQPEIIAAITRAMCSSSALKIQYASLSSGVSEREIVPHAFLNTGHRWHVRAFDRKSQEFRDFVCTRIIKTSEAKQNPKENELQTQDLEWQSQVTLQLVPHPNHKFPKAIELDYQMQNQQLELTLRVAEAKYLLRFWNVDVTAEHSNSPDLHHLWLKNTEELRHNNRLAQALSLALPTEQAVNQQRSTS